MKEIFVNNIIKSFRNNYQIVFSVSYLFAIATGMLFNAIKYRKFGINIFDYSDILDFLITPFSDYQIILFALASLIMIYLFIKFDFEIKQKYPKLYSIMNFGIDRKKWFYLYRYFCITIAFGGYMYIAAGIYGNIAERQINAQKPIIIRFVDNEVISGILIGKTKNILFIKEKERVKAIPINSFLKYYEIK